MKLLRHIHLKFECGGKARFTVDGPAKVLAVSQASNGNTVATVEVDFYPQRATQKWNYEVEFFTDGPGPKDSDKFVGTLLLPGEVWASFYYRSSW